MHRTQFNLEDAQYIALRERARRSGKSMGLLIRELLERELGPGGKAHKKPRVGLSALKGIFSDSGLVAWNHDEALYGGS